MSDSSGDPNGNDKVPSKPTRRQLIAGIAALVAGAAARPLPEAEADNGDFIQIGQRNDTNSTTTLASYFYTSGLEAPPPNAVFQVSGIPSGGTRPAIFGQSGVGATTANVTLTAASGVVGLGRSGVVGGAGETRAFSHVRPIANHIGQMNTGAAFFNDDDVSTGVFAYQGQGLLNVGVTVTGQPAAIHGLTFRDESVAGVFEHGNNGTAIRAFGDVEVIGRISATEGGAGPSACGRATIPAGTNFVDFRDDVITPNSLVTATLLGNAGRAGAPITLSHVVVVSGRTRIILTGPAARNTVVGILVFDC